MEVGHHRIADTHPLDVGEQDIGAGRDVFVGHQQPLAGEPRRNLGGFSSRCSAEVENPFPRLGIERSHCRQGRWLLHIKHPRVMIRMVPQTVLLHIKALGTKRNRLEWERREGNKSLWTAF